MIFGKWKDPGQRLTPQETCFPSKRIQQTESTARPLSGLSFKFFCRSKSIRLGSIPDVDNPLRFRLCSCFPGYRDHSGTESQKDSTIRLDFRPHRSKESIHWERSGIHTSWGEGTGNNNIRFKRVLPAASYYLWMSSPFPPFHCICLLLPQPSRPSRKGILGGRHWYAKQPSIYG